MLTIDSREDLCIEPVKTLFESRGVEVVVKKMDFGDYLLEVPQVDGSTRRILIERKTPSDFISSTNATIKEPASKIARQLNGCLEVPGIDQVVLLIDGSWYPIKGGRIKTGRVTLRRSPDAFLSQLRTIANHGIVVEHNPTEWYLPQHIYNMYSYAEKAEHTTLALTPRSFSIPAKDEVKWTPLMGIRGVGPKMAQALYAEFGSIKNVANASKEELIKRVKGLGEKTAEEILWYLN